eukprot:g2922.t1
MGTTCSRGPKYIYVLDSSGNGFAAADMDPWDWDRLMSFVKDRPVTQLHLDRAHTRFRSLCIAASRRKGSAGRDANARARNKVASGGPVGRYGIAEAGVRFKNLDPHFSAQVIEAFKDSIVAPCAEAVITAMFDHVTGRRLSFVEFLVTTYNFCALRPFELMLFMLSLSGLGEVDELERDSTVDMSYIMSIMNLVHGHFNESYSEHRDQLLRLIACMPVDKTNNTLELGTALRWCLTYPIMIFPLLSLQKLIQRKILGDHFWAEHKQQIPTNDDMERFGLHQVHVSSHTALHNTGDAWLFSARVFLLQQLDTSHMMYNLVDVPEDAPPPRIVARVQALIDGHMCCVSCLHADPETCAIKGRGVVETRWKLVTPCGLCEGCRRHARDALKRVWGYKWQAQLERLATKQDADKEGAAMNGLWMQLHDEYSDHTFYFNAGSGESQWNYPSGWDRPDYSCSDYYSSDDEEERRRKAEKVARKQAAKEALKEAEQARKAARKANKVAPDVNLG